MLRQEALFLRFVCARALGRTAMPSVVVTCCSPRHHGVPVPETDVPRAYSKSARQLHLTSYHLILVPFCSFFEVDVESWFNFTRQDADRLQLAHARQCGLELWFSSS